MCIVELCRRNPAESQSRSAPYKLGVLIPCANMILSCAFALPGYKLTLLIHRGLNTLVCDHLCPFQILVQQRLIQFLFHLI